jgi:hypothetical protein
MAKRKSRSIKAKTPVDSALEIARNAIPKKPVSTMGERTVPAALKWGKGIPLDKLAYLNDDEMALVQANRMFKGKRKYRGIPAFPDPGDTAAGDPSGSDGPTYGGGGGSDSGAGGDGGMGSYGGGDGGEGAGTGGGSDSGSGDTSPAGPGGVGGVQSSKDTGATSTSPSGTGGTSPGDTKTTTTGPSTGPTDQPARSETSYSQPATTPPAAPSPTGSFQSPGGYDPTSTAPSTEATNAALNRIAEGSSVLSSPYSYDPGLQKIPDRIAPVNYGQQPTVDMPDTTGANSPLSDPTLDQYDRSAYDAGLSQNQVAAVNAANQAALDARYVGSDLDAPVPGSGLTPPSYSDPNMVGPAPRETSLISAREPTDYVGSTTQQAAIDNALKIATNPNVTPAAVSQVPTVSLSNLADPNLREAADKSFATDNKWRGLSTYGSLNTPQETAMSQPTVASSSYTPTTVTSSAYAQPDLPESARNYAFNNPNSSWNSLRGYGAIRSTPQTMAAMSQNQPVMGADTTVPPTTTADITNPYYSSPAQQAADVRRTIALAQGPAVAPTEINIPGGDLSVAPAQQQAAIDNAVKIASNSPPTRGLLQPQDQSPAVVAAGVAPEETTGEFDYDPAQDPANYMQPIYPGDESGPGYFTPEERQAYLASIQGTRSSERLPYYEPVAQRDDGDEKEPPHRRRPRRPAPYVYRDYMYTNYPDNLPPADPDIINFNNYNQNLNRGGRIGDSVDAALRIAKSKLL